jgi:hypothetical protein
VPDEEDDIVRIDVDLTEMRKLYPTLNIKEQNIMTLISE